MFKSLCNTTSLIALQFSELSRCLSTVVLVLKFSMPLVKELFLFCLMHKE